MSFFNNDDDEIVKEDEFDYAFNINTGQDVDKDAQSRNHGQDDPEGIEYLFDY